MKSSCELCESGELSILGATSRQIAIGERCYDRLVDKNISWAPDTTLSDLLGGVRVTVPRSILPKESSV